MANSSSVWLVTFLFSLFFGHVFIQKIEASHLAFTEEVQTALSSIPQHQPYRTAFHFQPPKNWMNDPNGPMIHKGIYHLFYQWNPKGAVWGNIVWAHSTSKDLINWIPYPIAIYPSQPSDINGCWSGSTTILPGNKPVILYTGINELGQQVQNLAMPENLSDPHLVKWIKLPHNPLMAPTSLNKINSSSFRDPTTAWLGPDGKWSVIVGNKFNRRGKAILYRSKDFITWTEAKRPLHSAEDTGMWECPDFYPVPTNSQKGVDTSMIGSDLKHVLKASLDDTKYEYYTIGEYNHQENIYIPNKGSVESDLGLRYDYGKFYASKTFFDSAKNRRVLWGWINESTPNTTDVMKGWSGLQAIPRKIWLDKSGKQLIQWPVAELGKLRLNRVDLLPNRALKGGEVVEVSVVTATQADVEVEFEILSKIDQVELLDPSWGTNPRKLCGKEVVAGVGPFGLLVLASKGLEEYTSIYFRVFKLGNKHVVLLCADLTKSSLHIDYDKTSFGAFVDIDPLREKLSLRTLIDHSIVESFGGKGKACITSRVYPSLAIDKEAHLFAFNYGKESVRVSRLSAWSMKKAQIN